MGYNSVAFTVCTPVWSSPGEAKPNGLTSKSDVTEHSQPVVRNSTRHSAAKSWLLK